MNNNQYKNLFFCLLFISQTSAANQIQFPENWNCSCDDKQQCSTQTIQGQLVTTVPNKCSMTSSYINQNDAAVKLEVVTLEKPKTHEFIGISSDEGLFKLLKLGTRVTNKANRYHTVTGYANLKSIKKITPTFYNDSGQPMHVVNAVLHTSKTPRVGSILIAHGGSTNATFDNSDGTGKPGWIPLPLDYENQVPLDVHFDIAPKSIVRSINYEVDNLGNWGAVVHFNKHIPNGTKLQFSWEATVLTNDAHSNHYKTPGDVNEWLPPSAIIQANDPAIATTAQTFLDPDSKLKTVANLIRWMEGNMQFGYEGTFDAKYAFSSHQAPCTGYSNLAAAFGRALNIPSITLSGYLVGQDQETHWINQLYLGEDQGWFRIEPQHLNNIDPEYFIPVRINRFNEEIKSDFLRLGIPTKAYPQIPIGFDRPNGLIVDAENLMEFTDAPEKMNLVFNKARREWKKDFRVLLSSGKISARRQQIRLKMKNVQNLSELDGLLSSPIISQH